MRAFGVLCIVLCIAAIAVIGAAATGANPPVVAKKPVAKAAKPAPSTTAQTVADKNKKKSVLKKVLKSPIKGQTPKLDKFKGKNPAERGKSKVPTKMTRANAGMGGSGYAQRSSKPPVKLPPAPKKPNPLSKPNGKGKNARFRSLEAADASDPAPAEPFPRKTANGWKLSDRIELTTAQVDAITALMPRLPTDKVFFHWDGFQACTRWSRAGLNDGEMAFFDSQMTSMFSGGGLYMAESAENSANFGLFPCRITIKKDTPLFSWDIVTKAVAAKLLSVSQLTMEEKVALGQVIPFLHNYGKEAVVTNKGPFMANGVVTGPMPDWHVTHSNKVFGGFAGGNYQIPGTDQMVSPHWENNGDGGNLADKRWSNTITTSLQLYAYWNRLMNVDQLVPAVEPESAKRDLVNSLSWLKSFTFLFSYIDGASLFRALGTSPNDPFNVFEKQRFPNFQAVYEKYINHRLSTDTPSIWGVSASGKFGDGVSSADVWAKKQLEQFLPNLYKELSQGGVMKFRDEEVRAGGDESGKTFIATTNQVAEMKRNPYLLVVDSPVRPDTNDVLVYYYYPDPLHRNPALKSKVSPELWTAMEQDIVSAGADPEAYQKTDTYKQHTLQLMSELILDAFRSVHGQSAEMDAGGLQIMLALVSIHPCTDFNGRTTRFYGVVGALESSLEPPIAFMSDFDLTSSTEQYGKFLKSGTAAYLKLKLALTGELLTGVCNGQMPDHYHVGYWRQLATDALAPFGASADKPVVYDENDWDDIRSRRFVVLMDKKMGKNWAGRNGDAGKPLVATAGDKPPIIKDDGSNYAAPAMFVDDSKNPESCVHGNRQCGICVKRLKGTDGWGCAYHKVYKSCTSRLLVKREGKEADYYDDFKYC